MRFILTQRSNPSRIYMARLPIQKPIDWESARDLVRIASVAQHRSNARFHWSTGSPETHRYEATMIFDNVLAGIVTVVLLVYLLYALWNPQRF
jgi:K+-transporting ATPase KdpF subunit